MFTVFTGVVAGLRTVETYIFTARRSLAVVLYTYIYHAFSPVTRFVYAFDVINRLLMDGYLFEGVFFRGKGVRSSLERVSTGGGLFRVFILLLVLS